VRGGLELAHAVAGERDSVGVVDDAIEDGVGQGRIADDLVLGLPRFRGEVSSWDEGI
jgi:hypothetical protein